MRFAGKVNFVMINTNLPSFLRFLFVVRTAYRTGLVYDIGGLYSTLRLGFRLFYDTQGSEQRIQTLTATPNRIISLSSSVYSFLSIGICAGYWKRPFYSVYCTGQETYYIIRWTNKDIYFRFLIFRSFIYRNIKGWFHYKNIYKNKVEIFS